MPLIATSSLSGIGRSRRESKNTSAGIRFSLIRGSARGVITSASLRKRAAIKSAGILRLASSSNESMSILRLSCSLRRDLDSISQAPSVQASAIRSTSETCRVWSWSAAVALKSFCAINCLSNSTSARRSLKRARSVSETSSVFFKYSRRRRARRLEAA